jgi:signal transduction histidine kinase
MSSYGVAEVPPRRRQDAPLIAAGVTGAALSGLAAAVVLVSGQPGEHYLIALAGALTVAVPVAVGLGVWGSGAYVAFGRLLVAWGLLNFLPVLSHSSDGALYSLGRIGVWLVEPVAIAAMLAFPWGQPRGRIERGVVIGMAATIAVLYLPTALMVERYPEPAFWVTCYQDCPDNAFMWLGSEPGFVEAWLRPLRELITVAVYVAVVVLLAWRLHRETHLGRRLVTPVLTIAILRCVTIAVGFPVRRADPTSIAVDVLSWVFVLCFPALAVAFFIGIVRSRLLAGSALRHLAVRLRQQRTADQLRDVLASTLEDRSLDVVYWMPAPARRWVDAEGREMQMPDARSKRAVTEVRDEGRRVAAIIHDPALCERQPFVEAAATFALTALENQRLKAQVDASLESLRESRARIQEMADSERRRIERDLHDGAQQRLVALRVRLELAAEAVEEEEEKEEPASKAALLRELGGQVEEVLDDVRALARGIYPSLLADHGLDQALREAARQAPIAASVETRRLRRYSAKIETAVYFCCLEALQNVAKHGQGAASASIVVMDDGVLRFEVRDDGPGFDVQAAVGTGLTNMRDRVRAIGGALTITSRPGEGTRVAGFVPLP